MILWIILFLLIVAISFVLAFSSMKDYQEVPQHSKAEYGLFLIRQTDLFTPQVLSDIHSLLQEQSLVMSFERLFKGQKAALVIFGPKQILEQFKERLNLLELEDYATNLNSTEMVIWEVGVKDTGQQSLDQLGNIFQSLPPLADEDQFFWQVVIGAKTEAAFQTQIRAAIYSGDPMRRSTLIPDFQNLNPALVKVPRPFSQEQLSTFYKLRSLGKDSKGPLLTSAGVISLLKVS